MAAKAKFHEVSRMKDLTQGSIACHLLSMALPAAVGMVFQTLYVFIDLWFVAKLGDATVAGISAASNAMLIFLALTQVLSVGTVALISHAVGRKDQKEANLIFNQSLLIGLVLGSSCMFVGYALTVPYLRVLTDHESTVMQGRDYLFWLLPGVALQFVSTLIASALQGTGVMKATLVVQVATVLIRIALAPVLIAGWVTGYPMGAAGAGMAGSIAAFGSLILLYLGFRRQKSYISLDPEQWQPRFAVWKRILMVGLPAGGELLVLFLHTGIAFWAISTFGAPAQAGYGIGSRIMQAILLPSLAIASVVGPVAGQNFGARQIDRVRETVRVASIQTIGVMLIAMLVCQWKPEAMMRLFSPEPEVVRVGALYLQLISWNFVFIAVALVSFGLFQALANTLPILLISGMRLVVYSALTISVTSYPDYKLEHVWYMSIVATLVQTAFILFLLQKQMRLLSDPLMTQRDALNSHH